MLPRWRDTTVLFEEEALLFAAFFAGQLARITPTPAALKILPRPPRLTSVRVLRPPLPVRSILRVNAVRTTTGRVLSPTPAAARVRALSATATTRRALHATPPRAAVRPPPPRLSVGAVVLRPTQAKLALRSLAPRLDAGTQQLRPSAAITRITPPGAQVLRSASGVSPTPPAVRLPAPTGRVAVGVRQLRPTPGRLVPVTAGSRVGAVRALAPSAAPVRLSVRTPALRIGGLVCRPPVVPTRIRAVTPMASVTGRVVLFPSPAAVPVAPRPVRLVLGLRPAAPSPARLQCVGRSVALQVRRTVLPIASRVAAAAPVVQTTVGVRRLAPAPLSVGLSISVVVRASRHLAPPALPVGVRGVPGRAVPGGLTRTPALGLLALRVPPVLFQPTGSIVLRPTAVAVPLRSAAAAQLTVGIRAVTPAPTPLLFRPRTPSLGGFQTLHLPPARLRSLALAPSTIPGGMARGVGRAALRLVAPPAQIIRAVLLLRPAGAPARVTVPPPVVLRGALRLQPSAARVHIHALAAQLTRGPRTMTPPPARLRLSVSDSAVLRGGIRPQPAPARLLVAGRPVRLTPAPVVLDPSGAVMTCRALTPTVRPGAIGAQPGTSRLVLQPVLPQLQAVRRLAPTAVPVAARLPAVPLFNSLTQIRPGPAHMSLHMHGIGVSFSNVPRYFPLPPATVLIQPAHEPAVLLLL